MQGLTNGTPPVGHPTQFVCVNLFLILQAWYYMPATFRLFYFVIVIQMFCAACSSER